MLGRRILLVILCAAFAAATSLAYGYGSAAEPPCAMAEFDAGAPPCDGCDDAASWGCVSACALASSAAMLVSDGRGSGVSHAVDRVLPEASRRFASLTGPPGLQPPR